MSSLDDAKNYIAARFGPSYRAWEGLTDDDKSRTLVTADDYIDTFPWQGKATGTVNGNPTSRAWPRSGVVVNGLPVDSTTVPDDIVEASFELAVLLVADPALPNKLDQGSNIQAANAGGGTGVTFFAPTSARQGNATTLPVIVLRMVAKYLATPPDVEGGWAGVGKCQSSWAASRQYTLVRGEE